MQRTVSLLSAHLAIDQSEVTAQLVEHLDRQVWIGRRLDHDRGDRCEEDGLGDPLRTVPSHVARRGEE